MGRAVLAAAVVTVAACGPGEPATPDLPTRETFVAAYVDLRGAAGRDAAARDSILEEHGITAADMRRFVEHHSRRPAFLAEVWAEATETPATADSRRDEEGRIHRPMTPVEEQVMPEAVRPRRGAPPGSAGGGEELPAAPADPEG